MQAIMAQQSETMQRMEARLMQAIENTSHPAQPPPPKQPVQLPSKPSSLKINRQEKEFGTEKVTEKVAHSSSNITPFPRRSDSEVKLDPSSKASKISHSATSHSARFTYFKMALFATRFITHQCVKFARTQILSFRFTNTLGFECDSQLSYIRYTDEMEKQGKG